MSINIAQLTKEVNALNHKIDMLNKQINKNIKREVVFEVDDGQIIEINGKEKYLFYDDSPFVYDNDEEQHLARDMYNKIKNLYDKNKNNTLILEVEYTLYDTTYNYTYNLNVNKRKVKTEFDSLGVYNIDINIYSFGEYKYVDDILNVDYNLFYNDTAFMYFELTAKENFDNIDYNPSYVINGLTFQTNDKRFSNIYYDYQQNKWLYKVNSETLTYSTIDNVKIKITYVVE